MIKLEFGEYETLYEAGSGGCGQVYFALKKEDTNEKPRKGYILKTALSFTEWTKKKSRYIFTGYYRIIEGIYIWKI